MSFLALWIGVLIFGLGAIFSLLSAIRTIQVSRRWSDYRLRRRYIVQARGSVLLAVLSGALAVALLVFGRLWQGAGIPAALPSTSAPVSSETATPLPGNPPTDTPVPPSDTPTVIPATPTPIVPPTSAITATPAMPIAVQAMIQGTVTPAFGVQFGRLRFSTEIDNYSLVAPGEEFHNPIKQVYSVFSYQPLGIKVQWTALWYQNGELKHVDTTSWQEFPPGVAVAGWVRPAPEWTAGEYEVQIFVGTDWKASGRFTLKGEPPTRTVSPAPTVTASVTPTQTASGTPTITFTPTASPLPPPTRTARPTQTFTPSPSVTARPSPTPTKSATFTPAPTLTSAPSSTPTLIVALAPSKTSTPRPTLTPPPTASQTPPPTASFTASPQATRTRRPTATPVPSRTASSTPSRTPIPTATSTFTPTPRPVSVDIYFTNTRGAGGKNPPFAQSVRREVPGSSNLITAALDAYFAGPTIEEQAAGLVALRNGFVGYRRVEFVNGTVLVYLAGNCQPTGTGYSIAQPLIPTLKQFPGVLHVKIYDAYDHTGDTLNAADSWPLCLDVVFTSTATPRPTGTSTPTASPVPTRTPIPTPTYTPVPSATPVPTRTLAPTATSSPLPTATSTPLPTATRAPTRTPFPTATSSPLPTATSTPRPTATASPLPTRTPLPSSTATPAPTGTPIPTRTPLPTRTPTISPTATRTRTPTATLTPSPTFTPSVTPTPTSTNTPRPTLTLTPINAPTRAISPATQSSAAVSGNPTPTLDALCNRAEFLGDVTIVDNATLRPGEIFRKTWRLRNDGNCPWTAAYNLVFVRGDRLGGAESIPLPALVPPGQTADISVDLVAPNTSGQYQGFWQLRTPEGTTFGIGPAAAGNLWVQIRVAGQPLTTATASIGSGLTLASPTGWAEATLTAFAATETAALALTAPSPTEPATATPVAIADFATIACTAQWQANEGVLSCPGQDGDPRGSVATLSQADLEDGTTVFRPVLRTIPSASQDGYILGLYPQYEVQPGDRFQASVGCEHNADTCSVLFRLSYLDASGAAHDLWSLGEFYDGQHFDLDLDLGPLAGQQVRLVLSVHDLGSSAGDRALWIEPRIVRLSAARPTTSAAPTSTLAATATSTLPPIPTMAVASPTMTAPVETPAAPLPQFLQSVIDFFRRLFGAP